MTEQSDYKNVAAGILLQQIFQSLHSAAGALATVQSDLEKSTLIDDDPDSLFRVASYSSELESAVADTTSGDLRERADKVDSAVELLGRVKTFVDGLVSRAQETGHTVALYSEATANYEADAETKMKLFRTFLPKEPQQVERTLSTSVGLSGELTSEVTRAPQPETPATSATVKIFPDPMEEASALEHINQVIGAIESEISNENHEAGIRHMLSEYAMPRLELSIEQLRGPITSTEINSTKSSLLDRVKGLNAFILGLLLLKETGAELAGIVAEHWEPFLELILSLGV